MSSTIFILIMIIGGPFQASPKTSTEVEFYTEAKCLDAKNKIKADVDKNIIIHLDCHRK